MIESPADPTNVEETAATVTITPQQRMQHQNASSTKLPPETSLLRKRICNIQKKDVGVLDLTSVPIIVEEALFV